MAGLIAGLIAEPEIPTEPRTDRSDLPLRQRGRSARRPGAARSRPCRRGKRSRPSCGAAPVTARFDPGRAIRYRRLRRDGRPRQAQILPGLYHRDSRRAAFAETRIIGAARIRTHPRGVCQRGQGGARTSSWAASSTRRSCAGSSSASTMPNSAPGHAAGRSSPSASARRRTASASAIWQPRPQSFRRSATILPRPVLLRRLPASCSKAARRDLASARRSTTRSARFFERSRFSASITISARRRCRTCWCCASPTSLFEPMWNARAHRPRPDHGGRGARRRGPRRLLRQVRRAARHGAEPHAAAPLPRGDGAAADSTARTRSATRSSRCCAR